MKNRLIIILCVFVSWSISHAQDCPPSGLYINSQADIDQFILDYPNCTIIEGELQIDAYNENIELNALSNIVEIKGDVTIEDNNLLPNLMGLNNLKKIDGLLEIRSNSLLSNLDGLENLNYIEKHLQIEENENLISLDGLDNLSFIGEFLQIYHNPNLINIDGLSSITTINSDIIVIANGKLQNVDGFLNLTTVNGSLNLSHNWVIKSLTGLNKLESIGGDLSIMDQSQLKNLDGLNNITMIEGNLSITIIDSIINLNPLGKLESIGGDLFLEELSQVKDLNGLNNLTLIDGSLSISDNESLINLNALENLLAINGSLIINDNDKLKNIEGLINIDPFTIANSSSKHLAIYRNPVLSNCSIQNICDLLQFPNIELSISSNKEGCDNSEEINFVCGGGIIDYCKKYGATFISQEEVDQFILEYPNCKTIRGALNIGSHDIISDITDLTPLSNLQKINQQLLINRNPYLTSLEGLHHIDTVENSWIIISDNPSLTDLSGLRSLTTVNKNFIIDNNDQLTDLSGLDSLKSINGDFLITNNDGLTSLTGIEKLDPETLSPSAFGNINDLEITYNSSLSDCAIENICEHLNNLELTNTIHTNATGCNNPNEVKAICDEEFQYIGDIIFLSQQELYDFEASYPMVNTIVGDVCIGDCITPYLGSDINDLTPLSNITTIIGDLRINQNSILPTLAGLGRLNSIDSSLYINNNALLVNLTGLEQLNHIGQQLTISNNDAILSLNGIQNIDPNSFRSGNPKLNIIKIQNNPNLSTCNVEGICSYLELDEHNTDIHSNNTGCNDVDELLIACTTSTQSLNINQSILLYPNPAHSALTISNIAGAPIEQLTMTNTYGQKVMVINNPNEQIDISNLKLGMYFVTIKINGQTGYKRLVVE